MASLAAITMVLTSDDDRDYQDGCAWKTKTQWISMAHVEFEISSDNSGNDLDVVKTLSWLIRVLQ
jgi:hypothetical protein